MTHWPDLTMLELLVNVQRCGSLSAAAEETGLAQPNASRALARWEKRLGLALLKRTPRGSTLTESGELVVEWAQGVLTSAQTFLDSTMALGQQESHRIAVGASLTIAEYLLPRWLALFNRRHPEGSVSLSIHNSAEIFRQLASGRLQIGFVESATIPEGITAAAISRDELVLVVDPQHRWAQRSSPVELAELAHCPLVMRERGSGTRQYVDHLLAEHHPVGPAAEVSTNAAVKISVCAGLGPAVLSSLAAASQLATGELIQVPLAVPVYRTLHAVWAAQSRLSEAEKELIRFAVYSAHPSAGQQKNNQQKNSASPSV